MPLLWDNPRTKNKTIMKYLFIILTICLFSCSEHKQQMHITIYSPMGGYSYLECDSASMVSTTEAIYWVNGYKGKVIATSYLTINRE